MKTAVSLPDAVFEEAERLAQRTKKTRSRLFCDAVKEYLARHAPEDVTDAMDRVCDKVGHSRDRFVSSAARRVLQRSEW
jgi:antitoxin MazE6